MAIVPEPLAKDIHPAWVLGLGDLLPSAHRWFLVLLAPALVYRRLWLYVRDFAPFAAGVLVYEWARTANPPASTSRACTPRACRRSRRATSMSRQGFRLPTT